MKKLAIATLAGLLASGAAMAQDWDKVEVKTEPVAGSVSVLFGAGGNIGISAGADGVFLVDDQYAPLTERIISAIQGVSTEPIRYVISTHFHEDHTGGNENMGNAGAVLVAHDNVRLRLSKGSFVKAFNMRTPPKAGKALPVITFNDQISFFLNGEEVRAIHIDNAHTDGDAIIWFKGSNVIHMGDTFFNGRLPFVDVPNGGDIDGVISAAEMVLASADDKTRIIPGHGPVTDRAGLERYHDMLVDVRDRIADLKAAGKTLDETVAENPLEGVDAFWMSAGADWNSKFIGFVYDSL
ncbi:MAG: MBL fold metallo-hydrolase [Alphaproteobacteria bacterium]|nr:MAG: MBL fold metallo-hydrolase [Alphaproteobacteria bacterium]